MLAPERERALELRIDLLFASTVIYFARAQIRRAGAGAR